MAILKNNCLWTLFLWCKQICIDEIGNKKAWNEDSTLEADILIAAKVVALDI